MSDQHNQPLSPPNEPEFTYSDDFKQPVEAPINQPEQNNPDLAEIPLMEDEHDTEKNQTEKSKIDKLALTKAIAAGSAGLAASLLGVKSFFDIPRWIAQKRGLSVEKRKIAGELSSETEDIFQTDTRPALEKKRERLLEAINTSVLISPEKKAELTKQVERVLEQTELQLAENDTTHQKQVEKLLDGYLETRLKGTAVIKETINTALLATGFSTLRGVGYGAVALYERHQRVQKERASGEREGGYAKELIVNGLKETWSKLKGDVGETKTQKAVNVVQALGTVLRFVGFTKLGLDELLNEDVSEKLSKAIEGLEQKGITQFAEENYAAQLNRITLGALDEQPPSESELEPPEEQPEEPSVQQDEPAQPDSIHPEITTPPIENAAQAQLPEKPPIGVTDDKSVEALFIAEQENGGVPHTADDPSSLEADLFTKRQLDLGTVRSGDGLIRIAQRQLEADPERYGFDGNIDNKKEVAHWVRKTAFGAVTKAGLANQDGWVGLGGKGIGKMAITLSNTENGIGFNFVDAQTGEPMDPATLEKEHLTYDYHKPVEVPTPESSPTVLSPEEQAQITQDVGTTSDHDNDIAFKPGMSEQAKVELKNYIETRERELVRTKALLEQFKHDHANHPNLKDLEADVEKRMQGLRELEQSAREIALGVDTEAPAQVSEPGVDLEPGATFYGAPGPEPAEAPASQEPVLSADGSMLKFPDGHNELSPAFRQQLRDQAIAQYGTPEAIKNLANDSKEQMNTMVPQAMNEAGLSKETPSPEPLKAFTSKLGEIRFEESPDGKTMKIASAVEWNPVMYERAQENLGVSEQDVSSRIVQKAIDDGSKAPHLIGRGESAAYKQFLANQTIAEEMKASGLSGTKEYASLEKTNNAYIKKLLKKFPDLKEKFKLLPKQLDNAKE